LNDGRGAPLAVAVAGANRHDKKLFTATLDSLVVERPDPREVRQHLCLDKGFDYDDVREDGEVRGYQMHVRSRGEEAHARQRGKKARRWVVERTHSWLNRFRRILVRWEKKAENYQAMLHFASDLIVFNIIDLLR